MVWFGFGLNWCVLQKLEFSMLNADGCPEEVNYGRVLTGDSVDTPTPTAVCSRMRQIVARSLAEPPRGRLYHASELEQNTLF